MPTSLLALAPTVIHLAFSIDPQPRRVLDIGPGWGKYGLLLRENFPKGHFVEIDAVEMEPTYLEGDQGRALEGIYDNVNQGDVIDFNDAYLARYDLTIMCDVIEHMDKEPALELLDRIPGWIIISTPQEFFHNGDGLPESETHRSHWTLEDFGDRVEHDASTMGAVLVRLGPKS